MKWTLGASPLHPKAAELISGVLPDNSYSRTRGLPFRHSQKQHRAKKFLILPFPDFLSGQFAFTIASEVVETT